MDFFKNPFYVLDASPADSRQALSEKLEEKRLFLGSAAVGAYRILTNPAKRLEAELSWFPGLPAGSLAEITDYIRSLPECPQGRRPLLPQPSPLSELEMTLEEARIAGFPDAACAEKQILAISQFFSWVDLDHVGEDINQARETAGFPQLQNMQDVEDIFRNLRYEIKDVLSSQLVRLPEEGYISLMTRVAEQCMKGDPPYRGSVIIEDLVDTYALRMAPRLEDGKATILNQIDEISKDIQPAQIDSALSGLVQDIQSWDTLCQPIQYIAREQGQRQPDSEEIVGAARDLALKLHNEHGLTDAAYTLARALSICFMELLQVTDILTDDLTRLEVIIAEKERVKEEERLRQEELAASEQRNRMDLRYSVTLQSTQYKAPPFCVCCMTPTDRMTPVSHAVTTVSGNRRITRTTEAKLPLCPDCQKIQDKTKRWKKITIALSVLCTIIVTVLTGFIAPYEFRNMWLIPLGLSLALFFLLAYVLRLPPLTPRHSTHEQSVWILPAASDGTTFTFTNWMYAKWFARANKDIVHGFAGTVQEQKYRNRAKSNHLLLAIDHPFKLFGAAAVWIVITLFVCVWFLGSHGIPPSAFSRQPAAVQSVSPGPAEDGASGSPAPSLSADPSPSVDIASQIRLFDLSGKLETLGKEIDAMVDSLNDMAGQIESYEAQYYDTEDQEIAERHDELLAEYRAVVHRYEQAVDEYNAMVDEYNGILSELEPE